jgi:hypothetical protein
MLFDYILRYGSYEERKLTFCVCVRYNGLVIRISMYRVGWFEVKTEGKLNLCCGMCKIQRFGYPYIEV